MGNGSMCLSIGYHRAHTLDIHLEECKYSSERGYIGICRVLNRVIAKCSHPLTCKISNSTGMARYSR